MNIIEVKDFNLQHTLECGQFFRYKKIDNFYYVQSRNLLFKIKQDNNLLSYKFAKNNLENEQEFIKHFFNLNQNLKEIQKQIEKDKHIKSAIKKFQGLRLINQDPWECAISYICSSAANIPKIQLNINLLSKTFGKPIQLDNFKSHTFPEPGTINNLEKIQSCKVGFRTKFILEANQNLKQIHSLKQANYKEAKQQLMKNLGIGEKVADCICLFSLNKSEAFPVDTWVTKVMNLLYLKDEKNKSKISEFARNYFGDYAGYAQEYLFYAMRLKSLK